MRRLICLWAALLLLSACAAAPEPPEEPVSLPEEAAPQESLRVPEARPDPPEAPDNPPENPPDPPEDPAAFVRAADYIPGLVVDLRYAAEDNFTGQRIYDFSDAYLRYGTVQKLAAVQAALAQEDLGLKIWDAYRPPAAQFRLWEICPDRRYVADPNRGFSSHSRGNTLDLTLVDKAGNELEMPSGFDDFSAKADRDYRDASPQAAENAQKLEDAMTAGGFAPYSQEWWHFSDTNRYEVEEGFQPPADQTGGTYG